MRTRPHGHHLGRRRLLTVTCIAGFAAVATVGGGPAAIAASPNSPSGTTFTTAADTQIKTFNPFLAYFDGSLDVLGMIYPTLTAVNKQSKPIPYLATSWKTSPDKLTWTFKIRSGLKWSDGTPITAKDAAWTFNLIMHNNTAATANGSLVSNFSSVSAPNDTTLVIKTKKPQANMLYLSTPVNGIPIVPEHVWKKHVSNLKSFTNMKFPVVGYGPYKLVGNVINQYTTLKANKSFFMGAPHFDKFILRYFANSDAAAAALQSGELDELAGLTPPQYTALKKDKKLKTFQEQPSGWYSLEINSGAKTRSGKPIGNGNPILQSVTVRKAIALAINRKELVTKVLDGLGTPGASYLPPAYKQWAWKPSPSNALTYNPALANRILDQAGYKKGSNGIRVDPKTGKPLTFRFGIHSSDPDDAAIGPYIQEWLKAIGIKTKVQAMSFDQLNVNLAKGNWDMLMDAWSTGADPTYLLSIQTCGTLPLDNGSGGNTDAFYCNPKYDKLFNKQMTQFSQPARAATIRSMQSILYNANADVILFYKNTLGAIRPQNATNYLFGKPNSQGFYPLQNLFYNWVQVKPAEHSTNSSFPAWGIIVIIVGGLIIIVGGGGLVLRRRATDETRE